MKFILFMLLSCEAFAANSPYVIRDGKSNQDYGGLNANFSDISSCFQNSQNTTLSPTSCPSGQALTGAFFNSCGTQFGGVCEEVGSSTSASGFWKSVGGGNIQNTNSGAVNVVGGGGIDSNIMSMKTTSTTWTWSQTNYASWGSNPSICLENNDNIGLPLCLMDVPGGQRLNLWQTNIAIATLSVSGIYPTMSIGGDIAIGDIAAIGNSPMSLFYRVSRGIPISSCTNFYSSYDTHFNAATDAGATFQICPQDDAVANGNNDGYISLNANGRDSGSVANGIRFQNNNGSGTAQQLAFIGSSGLVMGSGFPINTSGANGNIISKSSMTASAFFGDGSNLTGSASGFTANLAGSLVGGTAHGMVYQRGSNNTQDLPAMGVGGIPVGGGTGVDPSTGTITNITVPKCLILTPGANATSFTAAVLTGTVTGSTITYTATGSSVTITASGSWDNTTGAGTAEATAGVIFDGGYIGDETSTVGFTDTVFPTLNKGMVLYFSRTYTVAAGSHTYALSIASSGGTSTVVPSNVGTFQPNLQFCVQSD